MSNVLALIPARSGSKGIPGKNFTRLAGLSPLDRVRDLCGSMDLRYVVTSDAKVGFSGPSWLQRPPELAQDDTPMIDVVQHALAEIPGPEDQIILLVQPTQPLREPKHITAALELLGWYTSVVSVVQVPAAQTPELMCWVGGLSGYLCPFDVKRGMFGGEPRDWSIRPTCRQETSSWYRPDGTVYAFRRDTVATYGNIFGPCCRPLIIPVSETCPLDTMEDWAEAERRLRERDKSM